MAHQLTEGNNLLPEHNVARYYGPRKIINGTVGYDAFLLRIGEGFLSTNWLEYFHPVGRQFQVAAVQNALESKGFRASRNGGFAILNVGAAVQQVYDDCNVLLNFRPLGQASDPSHTGIFGYDVDDTDVAESLAKSVQELHPAAQTL